MCEDHGRFQQFLKLISSLSTSNLVSVWDVYCQYQWSECQCLPWLVSNTSQKQTLRKALSYIKGFQKNCLEGTLKITHLWTHIITEMLEDKKINIQENMYKKAPLLCDESRIFRNGSLKSWYYSYDELWECCDVYIKKWKMSTILTELH